MISARFLLDFFGALLGLGYLFGIARKNTFAWPFGIASCAFFTALCYLESLWIQGIVQGINVILGFWGWYTWNKHITTRTFHHPILVLITGVCLVLVSLTFLWNQFPFLVLLDAYCLVFSVIATLLTIYAYHESWYLWLAVNAAMAWIAFDRSLIFLFSLSILYFLLSIYGHFQWKKRA